MMKTGFCLLSFCFLCACAGNPPAWWNPSGSYGAEKAAPATARPSLPAVVTAEEEEPVPMEQSIEPAMDNYEEMNLSPLSEGEMQEETQEAPAAPEEQAAAPTPPPPAVSAGVKETLPEDGSLPAPTVLE